MSILEDLETLRLFNEKASRLQRSAFVKQIEQGLGAIVEWKATSGWDAVHVGPNEESTDAAVLTMRFFVQNNERISLANMAELYQRLTFGRAHADRALAVRQRFNEVLDQPTNTGIQDDRPFTYREVMDLFLYGWLSHAKPDKAQIIQGLSQSPMFPIVQAEFAQVVLWLIQVVRAMSVENQKLLEIATASPSGTV